MRQLSWNQKRVIQAGHTAASWISAERGGAIVDVLCLQLARRGGHELAPAVYRERGEGVPRRRARAMPLSPLR
jgi:hypothetical protein